MNIVDTNKYKEYCCPVCASTSVLLSLEDNGNPSGKGSCIDCTLKDNGLAGKIVATKALEFDVPIADRKEARDNPEAYLEKHAPQLKLEATTKWFFTTNLVLPNAKQVTLEILQNK